MKTNFNFESGVATLALSELAPGDLAVVLRVDKPGAIGARLLDMGFLPNTRVSLIRRAPMGDPGVYELRGYQLCLRRSEASCIHVRRLEQGADVPETGGENPR